MVNLRVNTGRLFRLLGVTAAVVAAIAGTVRLLQPAEPPPLPADVGLPGAIAPVADGPDPTGGSAGPPDGLAGVVVELPPANAGDKRREGKRKEKGRSSHPDLRERSGRPAGSPQGEPAVRPGPTPPVSSPARAAAPVLPAPPPPPPSGGEFDFER